MEGDWELGRELELSSLGGPVSQVSHGYSTTAATTARERKAAEDGNASSASLGLGFESEGESVAVGVGTQAGAGAAAVGAVEGARHGRERPQQSHDDDEDDLSSRDSSSGDEEEDDAPFTYNELQARTQAARAAVNILLPNRTDDMAEREGLRRRRRGRR
jgi:hypothetical protein